jgi:hypothetical protein
VTEQEEPAEFNWSWIREAEVRELSAHGRQVQARYEAGPSQPARRPSAFKRLRFRIYLAIRRRRPGPVDDRGW